MIAGESNENRKKQSLLSDHGRTRPKGTSRAVPENRWLSGLAERTQIDHGVCQKLECEMPGLDPFKTEQQPFEFILPGERSLDGQALLMDGCVEESFPAALGLLAVPWILRNVGDHTAAQICAFGFF